MYNLEELDHLRMPLDHIKLATNDFSNDHILGQGGFGTVYEGQLYSDRDPGTTVAVKRLDVNGQQGTKEFLMEIVMLASCKHKNLVSLIGFVNEGSERILVYKKEDNGSLDKYLGSTDLTWEQRLRICVGAARGLEYLHGGVGMEHRVLHRDLKSSNILLDANWEAKISDFGLSKIGPRNTLQTFVATKVCGTPGYVDPQYSKSLVLRKESDVYSFGVVLFEVLCGRFATTVDSNGEYDFLSLSRLVNKYYGEGKLDEIIFPSLVKQAKPDSLELFSSIAFRCLNEDKSLRPTMTLVVDELESALEHQLGRRITVPEPQTGKRTKLWGSKTGGRLFEFQLKSNEKLKKITIYHNIWIHVLDFKAQDSNGVLRDEEYGTIPQYDMYFEGRHAPKFEIDLDADEEIIGLSGSIGVYNGHELVASLCFTTNKRKYGPFSHDGENRFSASWDGGLFNGFYGRHGNFIDAVGCYLKPAAN